MSQKISRNIPIVGVVASIALLAISIYRYSGDVDSTRTTVSLLCMQTLPDGAPNSGRWLPITAPLLLFARMVLLFCYVWHNAETLAQRKLIPIIGIGSMV